MWRAALSSLWSRKGRLVMSMVAIVLGVAFVAGSFVFGDMMRNSFHDVSRSTTADVEVERDPTASLPDGRADVSPLDDALVERIRQVAGVTAASGTVTSQGVVLIDTRGKALGSFGPPQLGVAWTTIPMLEGRPGVRLVEGREPRTADEVTVDPDSLAKSGHHVGDRVRIVVPSGTIEATIVGTATLGEATAGASYVTFTVPRARELFLGGAERWTGISVATAPDADRAAVAERVDQLLPDGFRARSGLVVADELDTALGSALGFVDIFLRVFAGIALLVATFLIVNTFSILVAQRSGELALFRALGASRRQIRTTVIAEALLVGTLSSVVGLFVGVGLAQGIKALMAATLWDMGSTRLTLSTTAAVVSLTTGVVVTLLASLGPAARATRIAPVEAMGAARAEQAKGLGVRAAIGVGLVALGLAAVAVGLLASVPQPAAIAGTGLGALLVGVVLASPLLGRPVIWLVGRLYRAVFGEVGHLAELNSLRQPRRTAATAAALMVGLAVVTATSIVGASAATSAREQVSATIRGDYLVGRAGFQEFPRSVGDELAAVDGVERVHRMQVATLFALTDGADVPDEARLNDMTGQYWRPVAASPVESFDQIFPQRLVEGRAPSEPGEMMVEQEMAAEQGLALGSVERLYSLEAQRTVELRVVGLYDRGAAQPIVERWVVPVALSELGLGQQDNFLSIHLRAGTDRAAVRTALDAAIADMPLVSVMDLDDYTETVLAQVNQTMSVMYALLALSILIAVLGIVNTLGLSIHERRREIGLLRAIALTRSQVRRMITLESVVIACLGAGVGIGVGLLGGLVLQRLMKDMDVTTLSIPWGQLAWFMAAAVVVGILAAAWPALRASRIDVLRAIATE